MFKNIDEFITTFRWYRELSLKLLEQIPDEHLTGQISARSIPMNCQIIDLGDMQLKIIELLSGKKPVVSNRPDDSSTDRKHIAEYLQTCTDIFCEEIKKVDPQTARLDWFGRMNFNFQEALTFIIAHEAMHHGEILSFIFAKDIEMLPALKNTWGFER